MSVETRVTVEGSPFPSYWDGAAVDAVGALLSPHPALQLTASGQALRPSAWGLFS